MKNDVLKYVKEKVEKEGFTYEQLSKDTKDIIELYKDLLKMHNKRKESGEHLANLEAAGESGIDFINKDLEKLKKDKIKSPKKDAKKPKTKESTDSGKAAEVQANSQKVLDRFEQCRIDLRKERERKIASGEIVKASPPTQFTKLKNAFVRIFKVLPADNEREVEMTRDELLESIKALFNLHGIPKWNLLADAVKDVGTSKINKLKRKEAKEKREKAKKKKEEEQTKKE